MYEICNIVLYYCGKGAEQPGGIQTQDLQVTGMRRQTIQSKLCSLGQEVRTHEQLEAK